MKDFTFNTIEEAIAAIKAGKMVLVTDDEDRENEGDLIMAAQFCTGESINFMAKEARGLICMPADAEIIMKRLFPFPSTMWIPRRAFRLMSGLIP